MNENNGTGSDIGLKASIADMLAASVKRQKQLKKQKVTTKLLTRVPKEQRAAAKPSAKPSDPPVVVVRVGRDALDQECLVLRKPFCFGFDRTFYYHKVMKADQSNQHRWPKTKVKENGSDVWLQYVPLEDLPLLLQGLHEYFDGKPMQIGDDRIVACRDQATP